MKDLLTENKIMNNKSILIIIGTLGICSISNAQSTYQKYDSTTRGVEYNITKSQINSNKKTIELLKESKKSYSVFDKNGSVTRSRIQGVICAKENENFRLNQKAFLLMDANRIGNIQNYNNNINQIRAQFPK